jgi:hypothetical protein
MCTYPHLPTPYSQTPCTLTPVGARTFHNVLELCSKYIAKEKENALTNIPMDLLSFLGMDAFPTDLQKKIVEKNNARRLALTPGTGSVVSVDRVHNPFTRTNAAVHSKMPNTPVVLPTREKEVEVEEDSGVVHKHAYPRILLLGPPMVVPLLREMVAFGRGLQKMTYREAVAVLQCIAATKINSLFRCYR